MSKEIRRAEEILRSAKIIDSVKEKESILISITRSVIKDESMDRDTIIYRLAMMLYHSAPLAGGSIIETLEDPGYIYLNLMEDQEIANLIKKKSEKTKFFVTEEFVKTFICFVISSYIYYRATAQ